MKHVRHAMRNDSNRLFLLRHALLFIVLDLRSYKPGVA